MTATNTLIDQSALYNGQLVSVLGFFACEYGNVVTIQHQDGREEEVPFSALYLL